MLDDLFRIFLKKPLELLLPKTQISPNILTLIGLVLGVSSFLLILMKKIFAGLLVFWLSRVFDGLDGALARKQKSQSYFGGFLDILCDFIVYALIPIGFAFNSWDTFVVFSCLCLLATFYINSATVLYLSLFLNSNPNIHLQKGLVEAFETYVFYSLFFIFHENIVVFFTLLLKFFDF